MYVQGDTVFSPTAGGFFLCYLKCSPAMLRGRQKIKNSSKLKKCFPQISLIFSQITQICGISGFICVIRGKTFPVVFETNKKTSTCCFQPWATDQEHRPCIFSAPVAALCLLHKRFLKTSEFIYLIQNYCDEKTACFVYTGNCYFFMSFI